MSELAEAVKGDLRGALEALRDELVDRIDAKAEPMAPLAKQLADVLLKIAALPAKEADAVDDLAAERAARRARVSDPSTKGGQRRAGSNEAGGKRRATA